MGLQKLEEQTMQQVSVQSKYFGYHISLLQELSTPCLELEIWCYLPLKRKSAPHMALQVDFELDQLQSKKIQHIQKPICFFHGWCNID